LSQAIFNINNCKMYFNAMFSKNLFLL